MIDKIRTRRGTLAFAGGDPFAMRIGFGDAGDHAFGPIGKCFHARLREQARSGVVVIGVNEDAFIAVINRTASGQFTVSTELSRHGWLMLAIVPDDLDRSTLAALRELVGDD